MEKEVRKSILILNRKPIFEKEKIEKEKIEKQKIEKEKKIFEEQKKTFEEQKKKFYHLKLKELKELNEEKKKIEKKKKELKKYIEKKKKEILVNFSTNEFFKDLPFVTEFKENDIEVEIEKLIEKKQLFTIFIVDPPWDYNQDSSCIWSGICAKHYDTMSDVRLSELKMKSLFADDVLVFIWVFFFFKIKKLN
jgi:hypothetical protein